MIDTNIIFENENARLLCSELQKIMPNRLIDFSAYTDKGEITEAKALKLYWAYVKSKKVQRRLM